MPDDLGRVAGRRIGTRRATAITGSPTLRAAATAAAAAERGRIAAREPLSPVADPRRRAITKAASLPFSPLAAWRSQPGASDTPAGAAARADGARSRAPAASSSRARSGVPSPSGRPTSPSRTASRQSSKPPCVQIARRTAPALTRPSTGSISIAPSVAPPTLAATRPGPEPTRSGSGAVSSSAAQPSTSGTSAAGSSSAS